MSEHGRANAVDLSGVGFSDGRSFGIFASDLPQGMSASVKAAACGRFSTVLGPGSDGFHESHLHVDMQPRRSKAKLCQWADPQVAHAKETDQDETEKDRKDGVVPKEKSSNEDGQDADQHTVARRKAEQADKPAPKRSEAP